MNDGLLDFINEVFSRRQASQFRAFLANWLRILFGMR